MCESHFVQLYHVLSSLSANQSVELIQLSEFKIIFLTNGMSSCTRQCAGRNGPDSVFFLLIVEISTFNFDLEICYSICLPREKIQVHHPSELLLVLKSSLFLWTWIKIFFNSTYFFFNFFQFFKKKN